MHSILIVDSIFREETFASVLIGTKGLNITCFIGSKVTGILQLMAGIWISSKNTISPTIWHQILTVNLKVEILPVKLTESAERRRFYQSEYQHLFKSKNRWSRGAPLPEDKAHCPPLFISIAGKILLLFLLVCVFDHVKMTFNTMSGISQAREIFS